MNDQINALTTTISQQLQSFRNREIDQQNIDWYQQQVSTNNAAIIKKLSISDLDLLTLIDLHPDSRVSDLTNFVNLRQGTISKVITKFVRLHLAEKYHRDNNRKNTYVKLTENGMELVQLHNEFHQQNKEKMIAAFNDFSVNDLSIVARFLTKLNQMD